MIIHCPHCNKGNRLPAERLKQTPVCGACQQELLALPINATAANFSELVTQSVMPVIVDFWAPWCGPCKMMAPVFAQFAKQQRGQAIVAKVDTERNPGVAARFAIRSIPTIALLKQGKEVARQVSAVPMGQLEQMVISAR